MLIAKLFASKFTKKSLLYVFASVFPCIYSKKSILLAKSFPFIQRKSDIKHVQLIKMLMSIWKMYEWKMKTQMPEVLFGIYGYKIKLILWLLRLKIHVSFLLLYKKKLEIQKTATEKYSWHLVDDLRLYSN